MAGRSSLTIRPKRSLNPASIVRLLCLAAPLCLASPLAGQTALCGNLKILTASSPAHWGLAVTALDGTPLCMIDAGKLFRPASNAKLFTAAAALALLGPDKTFNTEVDGKLDPSTGIVTGDLTLVGGGDANLDSGDLPYIHASGPHPPLAFHALDQLAEQLVAKGVKTVTGDVVGDDTLFPFQPYPFAWEADDLVWGFAAPVSALTLADNQLQLTIAPGKLHQPATVTLEQHDLAFYTVLAQVQTSAPKTPLTGIQVERLPGTRTLRVFGSIPSDARPDVEQIAMDDPAAFAAMAFRQILAAHGIDIRGQIRSRHRPRQDGASFLSQLHDPTAIAPVNGSNDAADCLSEAPLPTLATYTSPPLAQDVLFTLKTSQNLHAELLLHALGRIAPCSQGSTVAGVRLIRAFLRRAGIDPEDVLLFDGSGLGGSDLVTPRAVTQLLVYVARQPWFAQFKAALPVGGVDGTLEHRFEGPLKGKVFAKTGSLGETRALSGFLTAASGGTVIFSILVDNHPYGSTADRALADRLIEAIAAGN